MSMPSPSTTSRARASILPSALRSSSQAPSSPNGPGPDRRQHRTGYAASISNTQGRSKAGSVVGSQTGWAGSQYAYAGAGAGGSQYGRGGTPSVTGTYDHNHLSQGYDSYSSQSPHLSTSTYTISQAGAVPPKAQSFLDGLELSEVGVSVGMDGGIGWVGVGAGDGRGCEVWDYRGRPGSTPIAYTFPVPSSSFSSSSASAQNPPHIHLLPSLGHRDPSLLLITPSGSVGFYESVAAAGGVAAGSGPGVGYGQSGGGGLRRGVVFEDLKLGDGGEVRGVWKVSSTKFLISTTTTPSHTSTPSPTLRLLSIRQSSGHHNLHLSTFSLPKSKSTGFLSWREEEGVVDIAVAGSGTGGGMGTGERVGERTMWVLLTRSVQRWTIRGDVEIHQASYPITSVLSEGLVALGPFASQARSIRSGLNILGIKYMGPTSFLVLCSYTSTRGKETIRTYALAVLQVDEVEMRVSRAVEIEYEETLPTSFASDLRSVAILPGSLVAVVQLPGAAVLVSLAEGIDRQHIIQLKDSEDVLLSACVTGTINAPVVQMLASRSGVLGVEFDAVAFGLANEAGMGQEALDDEKLLQTIDQAIKYDHEDNPLYFGLESGFAGDIEYAVLEVAKRVIVTPESIPGDLDSVRASLDLKQDRLLALAQYLRENEILSKLSVKARHTVAKHQQTLEVALNGWWSHVEKHDRLINIGDTSPTGLLARTIVAYMEDEIHLRETGSQLIQTFFDAHLPSLISVLNLAHKISTSAQTAADSDELRARWLAAEGQLYLMSYQDGVTENMASIYDGLDIVNVDLGRQAIDQFLTDSVTVSAALDVYRKIGAIMDTRLWQETESSMAVDGEEGGRSSSRLVGRLQRELIMLAKPLAFAVERNAIQRGAVDQVKSDQRAAAALLKQSERTIADLLDILVRVDPEQTCDLAETHRNHPTLVKNTEDPRAIERYLDGIFVDEQDTADADAAQDFAQALFSKYEDEGRIYDLLNRLPRHRHVLATYLEERKHHHWAWMNDLARGEYAGASMGLEIVGKEGMGNETALALARLTALVA